MDAVLHHQTQADHFLALAESHAKDGNFARSADALERAVSHSAAAAASHWHTFPSPTRRQIGHILTFLAYDGHISHNSARSFHKFNDLHRAIARAQFTGDRPAARRTLRNTHRRVARIIYSVNQAIAAKPHPDLSWLNPEP